MQAVLACVVLLVAGGATVSAATASLEQQARFERMGGLVYVVTPRSGETLSAGTCDGLRYGDGVTASGGPMLSTDTDFKQFAGARPIRTTLVTPGSLDVWGLEATDGLWLGS